MDPTPEVRVTFASYPHNDYLVAELWADEAMVALVEWRGDVLVLAWLEPAVLWSLEVVTALSTAHQRLVDNRSALDRGAAPAS